MTPMTVSTAAAKAILLISCRDRAGIIAGVSNLLYSNGCNIIDSDQHTDSEDGHFFWRISFESLRLSLAELQPILHRSFETLFPALRFNLQLFDIQERARIVIMVSKLPHCIMGLLSPHHSHELH